jgi:hypothetical protein
VRQIANGSNRNPDITSALISVLATELNLSARMPHRYAISIVIHHSLRSDKSGMATAHNILSIYLGIVGAVATNSKHWYRFCTEDGFCLFCAGTAGQGSKRYHTFDRPDAL